jgi:hypothetical protein
MVCPFAILTIPALFIAHAVGEYLYPGTLKKIMVRSSWYTLEMYSRAEIYVSRLYERYAPLLSRFGMNKLPQPTIKFIHNGDEIVTYSVREFIRIQANNKIDFAYDFLLYEVPVTTVGKYDKYDAYTLRYEKHTDINVRDGSANISAANINFAKDSFELNMVQITFNNSTEVHIDLGRNQFMNPNNRLFDRPFLKWYLKKYKQMNLNDDDKYTITFIDHEMNYISLPQYCYLLIKKQGYDIINIIDDGAEAS